MTWQIINADCIEAMKQMEGESIDAVVTDPPYELGFMGKGWDATGIANSFEMWSEVLRVLKPGGHVLAFSGTRTYHRMVCAIEDAGFEIRDQIAWMFGSGFPKSLDVSKAIDKQDAVAERHARSKRSQEWLRQHVSPQQVNEATGTQMGHILTTHPNQPAVPTPTMLDQLRPYLPAVPDWLEALVIERRVESEQFAAREVVGTKLAGIATPGDSDRHTVGGSRAVEVDVTEAHTPEARQWQGWGTALKPAFEPIVVARKPLIGTVARNILEFGTGAINVDDCRIESGEDYHDLDVTQGATEHVAIGPRSEPSKFEPASGRWPANVVLDPEAGAMLDEQTGELTSGGGRRRPNEWSGLYEYGGNAASDYARDGDTGGASRFFMSATPDMLCVLCSLPCVDSAGLNTPPSEAPPASVAESAPDGQPLERAASERLKSAPAKRAKKSSTTTKPTGQGDSVHPNAEMLAAELIVHLARSAESLCEQCATATAQSVAQWLQGQTPDSRAGRVSTSAPNVLTLSRNLALIAAGMESTGITPTTADLKASFGSACHVTESATAGTATESSPSRFRYQSKTSSAERNAGLDGFNPGDRVHFGSGGRTQIDGEWVETHSEPQKRANVHPTVKPIALMRWLCRLITPPGGTVLDPFNGSGSTGCAAVLEGFDYIGIEREAEYVSIAEARIQWWAAHPEGMEFGDRIKADKARLEIADAGQLDMFGEAA